MNYELLFKDYQEKLKSAFEKDVTPKTELRAGRLLVKADFTGIQEFIFSIKSDGAARQLKGRSFAIQAMAIILQHELSNIPGFELLYNAGGNLYFFVSDAEEAKLWEFQSRIWDALSQEGISITLAWVSAVPGSSLGTLMMDDLEKQVLVRKLSVSNRTTDFFKPVDSESRIRNLNEFTGNFAKSAGYVLTQLKDDVELQVGGNSLSFLKTKLELKQQIRDAVIPFNNGEDRFLVNTLPHEMEAGRMVIKSFGSLAKEAFKRSKTEKLGVLKFDVDNLGKIFESLADAQRSKELSAAFFFFFEGYINHLLEKDVQYYIDEVKYYQEQIRHCNQKIQENQNKINQDRRNRRKYEKAIRQFERDRSYAEDKLQSIMAAKQTYKNNLYVIFSGGDDGFIVGAWDAVFSFAVLLRDEFENFCSVLDTPLTLSAAIMVIDEKFPVSRFADMAEDLLAKAKSAFSENMDSRRLPQKNAICLFDRAVSWKDFEEVRKQKEKLVELVRSDGKYKQPKALLNNIRQSLQEFENLKRLDGTYNFPKVWRLRYYFREQNIKRQPNIEEMPGTQMINQIVDLYEENLLESYEKNNDELAKILPLAARWAELELKSGN